MAGSGADYQPGGRQSRLAAEQAALRRVATLVARRAPPAEIFTAVAEGLGRVLGVEDIRMVRFDEADDQSIATVVASWGRLKDTTLTVGERAPLGGENVTSEVFRTGRSARRDDYSAASGDIGRLVREGGIASAAGAPVTVAGRLWGAILASATAGGPLPPDTEPRLGQFTELMGTAIANAEVLAELGRLAEEQAALRRVATLVAEESAAAELFAKVAEEVAKLFGEDVESGIVRYDDEESATVVAVWGRQGQVGVEPGGRLPLDGNNAVTRVFHERHSVRIDDYPGADGSIGGQARRLGTRSAVGCPISVRGRLWGAMVVARFHTDPFPPATERYVTEFTELVATAIANAEARGEIERLAEEQAGLRRVATLVAEGAAPAEIFETVITEVRSLLDAAFVTLARFEGEDELKFLAHSGGLDDFIEVGNVVPLDSDSAITRALRSGRGSRIDLREEGSGPIVARARGKEMRIGAAAPIKVEGETWGVIAALWHADQNVPAGTEARMGEFAQLLDTAIANAEARTALERLADEQAGLRRVATLVAEGAAPTAVFDAAMVEVCRLLDASQVGLMRADGDETTILAHAGDRPAVLEVGMRLPLHEDSVTSRVLASGRSARIDAEERGEGTIADLVRENSVNVTFGAPVTIEGSPWGVITASWGADQIPPGEAERRLDKFAQLLATAIANANSRTEIAHLAEEQAALRRVATLVAEQAPAAELFAKVAEEVAKLFGPGIDSAILRYEDDETAKVLAVWGEQPPGGIRVGAVLPVDGSGVSARVYRERGPVRIDDYQTAQGAIAEHAGKHGIRAAVGCPIVVEGRLWGAMVVAHYAGEPFSAEGERRVAQFAELVATAIANAEARAEVRRLAEEQAGLRRVATLVAQGAAPDQVFDAVVLEVRRLFESAQVGLQRYEGTEEATIVAQRRDVETDLVHVGMRVPLDGDSVTARVLHTGTPVTLDLSDSQSGTIAEIARSTDVSVTIGVPVRVEGRIWGVITASWEDDEGPPPGVAERLAEFAELLDTAVANADSRDQLTASRARVLSAGDEARRRVVRDLHDGAQQRLVHTIVTLKLAQRALGGDGEEAEALVAEALDHAQQGNAELRELAHGIMPSVLARGGLRAGVDAFAARLELPVAVAVCETRLPPELEASAYFVVAEALTNVVKHAGADSAEVNGEVEDGVLRLAVRDDGVGGADPEGHGLLGVADRVAALGGRLRVESPRGGGTLLAADLPLPGSASAATRAGR